MMTPSRISGRSIALTARRVLTTAAVLLGFLPLAAHAEYRIDIGDVIEISALGISDFKLRAKVGLDGQMSFPLLGQIPAAGETMKELREQVAKLLPNTLFRHKGTDGHDDVIVIDPNQLIIDLAEYRPVYVNGDVSKPCELPYRPGMTVLQAITLAGGYDMMHIRMENPFLSSPDLESDYKNLLLNFVREQAHALRLTAQLDGKSDFDRGVLMKQPIALDQANRIADLEAKVMAARDGGDAQERAFYKSAMDKADQQEKLLLQEQDKELAEAKTDNVDMERLRGLMSKGLIQVSRIEEQRRAILGAETRFLEINVQVTQMMRDRNDLGRKLQQVDEQRRMDLLKELQTAEIALAENRSKLQAAGEKLLYTDTVKSQLVRGTGGRPSTSISRKEGDNRTRLAANDDTELLPGDVLEVTLQAEYVPPTASR